MKPIILFLHIGCIIFISCNQSKSGLDSVAFLNRYISPEDSIKKKAAIFLLENMKDQISEGKPESAMINEKYLSTDIDMAFQLWNKFPWADSVPETVFLNYLLPYKIYGEEPSDWRTFFSEKYADSIKTYIHEFEIYNRYWSANEIYYRICVDEVETWYKYDPNPVRDSRYPGLKELLEKDGYDCLGWAYLTVMIMRSIGIPSAVDYVPRWGGKNGTHFAEVFWQDSLQSFITPFERELTNAAKVFRYTYEIQNMWKDSIVPFVKDDIFILDYLKNNHLLDVTHEHKTTFDIDYKLDKIINFAYICVFNYGEWKPIYWGKMEKDGKVCFTNMGTDILYRIAIPENENYKIVSPIFQLDRKGKKQFFEPNLSHTVQLQLSKLNTGARSWVEKGKKYALFYTDKESNWLHYETKTCYTDSLIFFDNIPSGTLYRLLESGGENRLERPFTYENGIQVFW
jgi:hypothetical protein